MVYKSPYLLEMRTETLVDSCGHGTHLVAYALTIVPTAPSLACQQAAEKSPFMKEALTKYI